MGCQGGKLKLVPHSWGRFSWACNMLRLGRQAHMRLVDQAARFQAQPCPPGGLVTGGLLMALTQVVGN